MKPSGFGSIVAACALVAPGLAHAHSGIHIASFTAGVAHPLTGGDHLLAMISVGIWAAYLHGRARWVVPTSFVLLVVAGALIGAAGVAMPAYEYAIAMSVVVLGLLIALQARAPTVAAAAIVVPFALAHGYAHGVEAAAHGGLLAFGCGFILSMVVLHLAGLALGAVSASRPAGRYAGYATAAAGVYFALGV